MSQNLTDDGASPTTRSPLGRGVAALGAFLALLLVPAALAQAPVQEHYFIQADTVRGAEGAQGAVCIVNSVFMQGEQIVYRAYVYDADTGEQLTEEQIAERGVKVYGVLDGERVAELAFIPHPPGAEPGELFWAGGFVIPEDHPTGNYAWSVQVEDAEGNTAEYLPMGHTVGLGTLMILEPSNAEPSSTGAAPSTRPGGS